MVKDVRVAIRGCGHCQAANIVSHEASQLLKTVRAEAPFDVMSFDVWRPGDIPNKGRNKLPPCEGVLTGLNIMTAFAGAGEVFSLDSGDVARVMVSRFFCVTGLPKLILIDDGSELKDVLVKTCQVLMVQHHLVTKGNHKAILCERFH